jgi:hypothetical protein
MGMRKEGWYCISRNMADDFERFGREHALCSTGAPRAVAGELRPRVRGRLFNQGVSRVVTRLP